MNFYPVLSWIPNVDLTKMKFLVYMVTLFGLSMGTTKSFGSCPPVRGVENFEVQRYLGVWYEYSSVFELFSIGARCVRATYSDLGNNTLRVFNEQVNYYTGNYGNLEGYAKPANETSDIAEFIVIFPDIPGGGRKTAPNYNVVKTDYESYAVVYNCNQYPLIKTESLWLLTREQNPSQELVEQLYSEMREMGLPVDSFYKTEQSNCTQLPEPGTVQYKFSPESLG
ncbi:apolipoprotein D isoform X1 [Eurytemora carolleeae]|uniref:apolipoprotein D isoform X1 n=1 Tax=Eurytemora carolleeae TaxID=1294199 RepID=UPI000C766293|nr:apolipoprotein D isoform X1 [Eurytemora carolleeae]|eukprot:XP_023332463.1 apolipoprotein D-like isoform X1 [Eurytemora affinis]